MCSDKVKHFGQESTGIILLAAGSSSRFGSPKQLIPMGTQTMIRHSLNAAIETKCAGIWVVLGAHADVIMADINQIGFHDNIHVIINSGWQEGLASSIRCGISHMLDQFPAMNSVILMLADQPFISGDLLLNLMVVKSEKQTKMVTCRYSDTFGPPTLIDRNYFQNLMDLRGNQGAKIVLQQFPEEVSYIDFVRGSIDIDTIADYQKYLNLKLD